MEEVLMLVTILSYVPFAMAMVFIGLPLVLAASYALCEAPSRYGCRVDTLRDVVLTEGAMVTLMVTAFAKIYSDVFRLRNPFAWLFDDDSPKWDDKTATIVIPPRV